MTGRLAHDLGERLALLTSLLRRDVRIGQISPTQALVLATLDRQGPKRVSELADIAHVAQPTMTTLLRKMADDGVVSRESDPDDQRAVLIGLTDAGRGLVRQVRAAREQLLDARLAGLAEADREAIARAIPALDKLLEIWRKEGQ